MKNLYMLMATALLATAATAATPVRKTIHRAAPKVTTPATRSLYKAHALSSDNVYTPTVDTLISNQPTGTLHANQYRSGVSFVNNMGYVEKDIARDGIVSHIVEAEDGKTVYIYNPLCAFSTKAWIKGTRTVGDTIEVKLPQYLTHYDNPEMGDDSFLFRMRPVKNDDNQLTFLPDDDQTVKFTWRNDTLAFVNTTADSRILGMATTAGEWGGFGDYVWQQTSFDATTIQPSSTEGKQKYAMEYLESGQVYGRIKDVVFEGNKVYIQGMDPTLPEAWIVGEINGKEAIFKGDQYLGIDPKSETFRFFEPAAVNRVEFGEGEDDYYLEVTGLADEMTLTYNADTKSLSSEDVMLINQGKNALNALYTYEEPDFSFWQEEAIQPEAVTELAYDRYDESVGYGVIRFIPYEYAYNEETKDYDRLLDTRNMYYNIYIDDQLYAFTPDQYFGLDKVMTDIPFDYSDQLDFVVYGGQYNIMTHFKNEVKYIGVQVVYNVAGQQLKSDIAYIGGDGNEINPDDVQGINQTTVSLNKASNVLYDLTGRRVVRPVKGGIYINANGKKLVK